MPSNQCPLFIIHKWERIKWLCRFENVFFVLWIVEPFIDRRTEWYARFNCIAKNNMRFVYIWRNKENKIYFVFLVRALSIICCKLTTFICWIVFHMLRYRRSVKRLQSLRFLFIVIYKRKWPELRSHHIWAMSMQFFFQKWFDWNRWAKRWKHILLLRK